MDDADRSLSLMQRAVHEALAKHWRLFLVQGVAMLILGVLAVLAPMAATLVIDIWVGWLFMISGVVGLVALFSTHNLPAFLWGLITAALSVVVGGVLLAKPAEGALTLTLVLTAFFLVEGVFQVVLSIAYHHMVGGASLWMLASGVADLVLAAIIIAGWPISASWALGLIVGVNLITSGWAIMMAAFAGRGAARA